MASLIKLLPHRAAVPSLKRLAQRGLGSQSKTVRNIVTGRRATVSSNCCNSQADATASPSVDLLRLNLGNQLTIRAFTTAVDAGYENDTIFFDPPKEGRELWKMVVSAGKGHPEGIRAKMKANTPPEYLSQIYSRLLLAYAISPKGLPGVAACLEEMRQKEILMTDETLSALITARMFRPENDEAAMPYVKSIESMRNSLEASGKRVSADWLGAVVFVCSLAGRVSNLTVAQQVLDYGLEVDAVPDQNTLRAYARRCVIESRIEQVLRLHQQLSARGFKFHPDLGRYLVQAYVQAGRADEGRALMKELEVSNLRRTFFLENYIVGGFLHGKNITEAREVLKDLLRRHPEALYDSVRTVGQYCRVKQNPALLVELMKDIKSWGVVDHISKNAYAKAVDDMITIGKPNYCFELIKMMSEDGHDEHHERLRLIKLAVGRLSGDFRVSELFAFGLEKNADSYKDWIEPLKAAGPNRAPFIANDILKKKVSGKLNLDPEFEQQLLTLALEGAMMFQHQESHVLDLFYLMAEGKYEASDKAVSIMVHCLYEIDRPGLVKKLFTDIKCNKHKVIESQITELSNLLDLYQVEKLYTSLTSEGHKIRRSTYKAILGACKTLKSSKDLNKWTERYVNDGYEPDLGIYTTLITVAAATGDVAKARAYIAKMDSKSIRPDMWCFRSLLLACEASQDLKAAKDAFASLERRGIPKTSHIYHVMIRILNSFGHLSESRQLFEEMLNSNVKVIGPLITSLVRAHVEAGQIDDALEIFVRVRNAGVVVDSHVLSHLISGFCRTGEPDKAVAFLNFMISEGITPSSLNFEEILTTFMNQSQLDEAVMLIMKMPEYNQRPSQRLLVLLTSSLTKAGRREEALALTKHIDTTTVDVRTSGKSPRVTSTKGK